MGVWVEDFLVAVVIDLRCGCGLGKAGYFSVAGMVWADVLPIDD